MNIDRLTQPPAQTQNMCPSVTNWPGDDATAAALAALSGAGIGYTIIRDDDPQRVAEHDELVARALEAYGGEAGIWDVHQLLAHAGIDTTIAAVESSMPRVADRFTGPDKVRLWRVRSSHR